MVWGLRRSVVWMCGVDVKMCGDRQLRGLRSGTIYLLPHFVVLTDYSHRAAPLPVAETELPVPQPVDSPSLDHKIQMRCVRDNARHPCMGFSVIRVII